MDYKNLLPPTLRSSIMHWLQEDIPSFDWGGYIVGDKEVTATLYLKSTVIYSSNLLGNTCRCTFLRYGI